MITAFNQLTDSGGSRSQHCGLFAVDVVGFTAPGRDNEIQHFLHQSLSYMLTQAFEDAQLGWNDCHHEDRGDGMLMIIPAHMLSATVIDPLLDRLLAGLRGHNRVVVEAAQIRLRVAIHVGEVHLDDYGAVGPDLNHVFRLLDAPVLTRALAVSEDDLALIVSDYFYENVIRREPIVTDPAAFQPVRVRVKETRARAWLYLPRTSTGVARLQPRSASSTPRSVAPASGSHETWEGPAGTLAALHGDSDQALDSILAAEEAEELKRIQVGLNLDAGLAAIMQEGSNDQIPATDADDSGEPQILAEVASNPRTPGVLPFRWLRKG